MEARIMTCQVLITKEENWYVATDVSSGVASQGKTIEESLANLKEALELYYEDDMPNDKPSQAFLTTLEVLT